MQTIRITRVRSTDADIPLPTYATDLAAGMDLCAAVSADTTLGPNQRQLVPTGFAIELPEGFEGQVRPRSGLALKHGITVLNAPGTVDADYRGEIGVILVNCGTEPFVVRRGDRIAQLVVSRHERVAWDSVAALAISRRGEGGFGHSGTSRLEGESGAENHAP